MYDKFHYRKHTLLTIVYLPIYIREFNYKGIFSKKSLPQCNNVCGMHNNVRVRNRGTQIENPFEIENKKDFIHCELVATRTHPCFTFPKSYSASRILKKTF